MEGSRPSQTIVSSIFSLHKMKDNQICQIFVTELKHMLFSFHFNDWLLPWADPELNFEYHLLNLRCFSCPTTLRMILGISKTVHPFRRPVSHAPKAGLDALSVTILHAAYARQTFFSCFFSFPSQWFSQITGPSLDVNCTNLSRPHAALRVRLVLVKTVIVSSRVGATRVHIC